MAERKFKVKAKSKIQPGQRFGRLTVIGDSGKRKNGYIVWHCKCSCGNEIDVEKRILQRGVVTSCGCIPKECASKQDITGQRFGKLVAEYCTGRKTKCGSYIWHLRCDCGNEIEDSVSQLKAGYIKSCGCLPHSRLKSQNSLERKKNIA